MSEKINSFRDLIVWQKGVELVVRVYELTRSFPDNEKYGLVKQMRRAAVSIPSNISEGHGRRARVDYQRFLKMSIGSCNELETQVEVSYRLEFLNIMEYEQIRDDIDEISRMLMAIVKKLDR